MIVVVFVHCCCSRTVIKTGTREHAGFMFFYFYFFYFADT